MSDITRHAIGPFGMVPIALLQDKEARRHVCTYAAVASFCGNGPWAASYDEIADRAGCSRRQAIESLKELSRLGWIGKRSRGTRVKNEYLPLVPTVETVQPVPEEIEDEAGFTSEEITTSPSSEVQFTSPSEVHFTSLVKSTSPVKEQKEQEKNSNSSKPENHAAAAASEKSFTEELRAVGLSVGPAEILAIEEGLRADGIREPAKFAAWLREWVKGRNPSNPAGFFRKALLDYHDLRERFRSGAAPTQPTKNDQEWDRVCKNAAAEAEREAEHEHRRKLGEEYGYRFEPLPIPPSGPVAEDVGGLDALRAAAEAGNPAARAVLGMIKPEPAPLAVAG